MTIMKPTDAPVRPVGLGHMARAKWERETIERLSAAGRSDEWIAMALDISVRTVARRREHVPGRKAKRKKVRRTPGLPKDWAPTPLKDSKMRRTLSENGKRTAALMRERRKQKIMEEQP